MKRYVKEEYKLTSNQPYSHNYLLEKLGEKYHVVFIALGFRVINLNYLFFY